MLKACNKSEPLSVSVYVVNIGQLVELSCSKDPSIAGMELPKQDPNFLPPLVKVAVPLKLDGSGRGSHCFAV